MPDDLKKRIRSYRYLFLHRRTRGAIERQQSLWLRELLAHARSHVPAYRELYANNVGAESGDLSPLPVITKDFFRTHERAYLLADNGPQEPLWLHTSGSSGTPLTIAGGAVRTDPAYVGSAFFRFLLGPLMHTGRFERARLARIDMRAPARDNQLFISIPDFLTDPQAALKQINDFKPTALVSFTSILLTLARAAKEHPETLAYKPRYIVSTGEGLTHAAREYIEDALGGEVYNRYGNAEVGAIALECNRHDGMHVNVESVIVEIIDGRIVVTDLLNYTMPFVRYDTGDRGRITYERCACGLETPRLWVEGRETSFLELGGRRIHEFELDILERYMHALVQYQLVGQGSTLLLRVVPRPEFTSAAQQGLAERLAQLTGVEVHIERVESIPPLPNGKIKIVASN